MAIELSSAAIDNIIKEAASVDPELKKEYEDNTPLPRAEDNTPLPRARPPPGFFRGMARKSKRGGARCAEGSRQRQIMRLLVLASTATGAAVGAPGTFQAVQAGLALLSSNASCTVSASSTAFQLTACAKYGELLMAMNRLATDVSMSGVLQGAITFAAGMSATVIVNKVKSVASSIYGTSKQSLESVVDYFCTLLFDEDGNFISPPPPPAAAPAAAAAAAPAAAAAAAPASSGDVGMTAGANIRDVKFKFGGGRKSRRSRRTLKKRKAVKRSTRKMSFRY